jgi:hypothetical protein
MRSKTTILLIFFSIFSVSVLLGADAESIAYSIIKAETDYKTANLWPGFSPGEFPAVIYDGTNTYLFSHPNPPPEFTLIGNERDVWLYEGSHTSVRANSIIKLNDIITASVFLEKDQERSIKDLAAVLIHEKFHAFQIANHKDWFANEAYYFTYPSEDKGILILRRMETEALVRAVSAETKENSECWVVEMLKIRKGRFSKMGKEYVEYERKTELFEGTAHYIEYKVAGKKPFDGLPHDGYAPEKFRNRAYTTGRLIAALLDRFDPAWKNKMEKDRYKYLDDALAAYVKEPEIACTLSSGEIKEISEKADMDIQRLLSKKKDILKKFLDKAGSEIVVIADDNPLGPAGFDPMNVERLDSKSLLHTRWVKLKNSNGVIEVLNTESMTLGCGKHPLFEGVCRITITGLTEPGIISTENGGIKIEADNVQMEFKKAEVERDPKTDKLIIRLHK